MPAPAAGPKPLNYLTDKHLFKIGELMPVYRWAAALVGEQTPIMLAVLHFRENGLRLKPPMIKGRRIPGGALQMDPGGVGKDLRARIERHARVICVKYRIEYEPIGESFKVGILVGADWFKYKSRGKPVAIRNKGQIERVADAYWGYNGRSPWHTADGTYSLERRHWRYSPYVSNDPQRGVCLRERGTMPDGMGGRKVINRVSKRPGALVIYRELQRRIQETRTA